jgi:protein-tyrosine phosphatase
MLSAVVALSACRAAPAPWPVAGDSALHAPRLISLEGAQNFRDVGGYRTTDGRRVKWGLIYRSADLSKLTGADLANLSSLGVQTVFDLRSTGERRAQADVFTGRNPTVSLDYDIDTNDIVAALQSKSSVALNQAVAAAYPKLLSTLQPELRQLFAELLTGPSATLYHCTAGKDRTGVATALILSALGVPRETIYADYLLSNRFYHPRASSSAGPPPELASVLTGVDESYLRAVFDTIDVQYGSTDAYLAQALGVDATKVARLRALYTEQ